MQKTKHRWYIRGLIGLAALIFVIYYHMIQTYEDMAFEKILLEKLRTSNSFRFDTMITSNVNTVCFIQSYATTKEMPVPEAVRSNLSRHIDGLFGFNDDNVWWLAMLKGDDVIKIYRLSQKTRPNIHGVLCDISSNIKGVGGDMNHIGGHFDIISGDE